MVNAGFRGSRPNQQNKQSKGSKEGPSGLNKVLDRLCQIHGTCDKPANHTHRECWVFKQADKLNVEHKERETPSEDEDEPRQPNTGGQKKFPPEVKTVNMIHTTRTSLGRHERAHKDAHDIDPIVPHFRSPGQPN